MTAGSQANDLSTDLADAVERAGAYTLGVDARRRFPSSGVVWANGVVVTADHTIEREEDIGLMLPDGNVVAATVAGRDPGSDLAVLRAEIDLQPAPRVTSTARVGQLVLAVGRGGPVGLSASMGIVSAVGGAWRARHGWTLSGFIRADLTMYPGFSGGPLIDVDGALLGINSSGIRPEGLTIPITAVVPVVEQLLAHGQLRRAYLGVSCQPAHLPVAIAAAASSDATSGLLVVGIEPDSPAEHGGLLLGDILLSAGDHPLRDTDDLRDVLIPESAGQATAFSILRGGQPRELTLTIGELPPMSRGNRHGRHDGRGRARQQHGEGT